MKTVRNRLFLISFSELYIGLKTATEKAKMQEKMLFEIETLRKELSRCKEEKLANTFVIKTLQKELSSCKEELLQCKTKHSPAMKPVVQLG